MSYIKFFNVSYNLFVCYVCIQRLIIQIKTRIGNKVKNYNIEVTGDKIIRFRGGNVTAPDFEFESGSVKCYYWQVIDGKVLITVSLSWNKELRLID